MTELNIKIGSRILSDDEARVLLPSYDLIYEQINTFTQKASQSEKVGDEKGEMLNEDILKPIVSFQSTIIIYFPY